MKKPIIGLTPSWDEKEYRQLVQPGYLESVRDAGGLPLMLSLTDCDEDIARYVELCDGFLFVGGPDVDPRHYGQERLEVCMDPCEPRDALEIKLMNAALKAGKPILGVCRGLQMLNVVLGGTLYQDAPSQHKTDLAHGMEPPYNRDAHPLQVVAETPLAGLLPIKGVNTRHHQAIDRIAPGLVPMAYAPDGLVEAAYMPEKKFVWAVQWHPEAYVGMECASQQLFQLLVEAAGGNV